MASLVCDCVSQANRIAGSRVVKRIGRIDDHLATIREKIIGQIIVVTVNRVPTNSYICADSRDTVSATE